MDLIRELLLRRISVEGWYVIAQQGVPGSARDELHRYGPTKNKPTNARLRELQFRHFSGYKTDVIVEE